ncbi:MAG: lytic transglycosylase domain-containing protein [Desulfotignum sp.]|jgi:hypothetical protein|nr:lytic transglycosylase domain-containing protein [Desulfotignum sp.]
MMERNYDHVIGRINPFSISKDVSAAGNASHKPGPEPNGFQELLQKVSQAAAPDAMQPDKSRLTLDKQEALNLYEQVRLQMNESLLTLLAQDGKVESSPGISMLEELQQMVSMGLASLPNPSTIGRAVSKKDLSTSFSPDGGAGIKYYPGTENAGKSKISLSGTGSMDEIIATAAETYGVDADLIHRVIQAESSFNPDAVSPVGAQGLMQLMPETAKELGVSDAFDPKENIMGGTRYLRQLLDRYDQDIPLALAAYNWGMGNVDAQKRPMPEETRNYVARITGVLLS